MSKKRPSHHHPLPPLKGESAYWLNRLFQNTFTYRGERRTVRKWSVKIQFQRRRKTFSLHSTRRADAALEACELYRSLLNHGWERPPLKKNDAQALTHATGLPEGFHPDYWIQRLVHREYTDELHPAAASELSVRIAHGSASYYFPLGTANVKRAARQAVRIYRAVASHDWESAHARFPRELTLALHWSVHPLAWTYTTIHTRLNDSFASPAPGATGLAVAVVEEDPGVRRALEWCLNHQPGVHCAGTYASAEQALPALRAVPVHLVLSNARLAERRGADLLDAHKDLPAGALGLLYSLYADSEELFATTPGGAGSYLLRRTRPTQLLEPAAAAMEQGTLAAGEIEQSAWRYFRDTFASLPLGRSRPPLADLTQREQEVLGLLSKGSADKEIAEGLSISVWTVHGHVRKILEKLGVHNRTGAVAKYLQK